MNGFSLTIRSVRRTAGGWALTLVEEMDGALIERTLPIDTDAGAEFERVLGIHPFPKKRASDDVVVFRGLESPRGDPQSYLVVIICNAGSRHREKLKIGPETYAAFRALYDGWCTRWEKCRAEHAATDAPPAAPEAESPGPPQ